MHKIKFLIIPREKGTMIHHLRSIFEEADDNYFVLGKRTIFAKLVQKRRLLNFGLDKSRIVLLGLNSIKHNKLMKDMAKAE